jgi:hypothetical protein
MLSGLHCLRSAPNEMPSPFSAASGRSTNYLARFSRHRSSAAMALTRCYASRPWSHVVGFFPPFGLWRRWWRLLGFQSVCCWRFAPQCCAWQSVHSFSASRPFFFYVHPPRFAGQSRGSFLVRFYRVVCLRQRWHTSVTGAPSQHAMPNSSIERTNNGGSGLRAFAGAQPPLFASHLKR